MLANSLIYLVELIGIDNAAAMLIRLVFVGQRAETDESILSLGLSSGKPQGRSTGDLTDSVGAIPATNKKEA
jgi:hypothetical protein